MTDRERATALAKRLLCDCDEKCIPRIEEALAQARADERKGCEVTVCAIITDWQADYHPYELTPLIGESIRDDIVRAIRARGAST